jgi:hypothetical protein
MPTPKLSQSVAVSESGFLFSPSTGESFTVNAVGRSIVSGLQKGSSEADILKDIISEFDVDQRTAERDLHEFLDQLRRFHLISGGGESQ